MPRHTRRSFLQTTGWTIAGLGLASAASKAYGANERVNLGVVGLSRGLSLAEVFNGFDDVRIRYLCDVDQKRLARAREKIKPDEAVTDLRRILDDDAVDAIVIATPDHWHAGAAILACQAGKHVYVEKPCSHNIREGRLMIDAARKHNRVMQVGTQTRSSEGMAEAVQ
ncbi:MAG: Gfo/Idh/MocA family oxidoreductase, partial [Candidatus Hydrogenedentes bacterium]|nr:Gfo/Idh/MocA family oxidoreductase [Candidatus Hydrogenedentota bacterium]